MVYDSKARESPLYSSNFNICAAEAHTHLYNLLALLSVGKSNLEEDKY